MGSLKTTLKCPSVNFYQVIDVCLTNYEDQFNIIKHKLNVLKNMTNHLICILKIDHATAYNIYYTVQSI